jgi:uncharacterized protein YgbK (DUF1537 family)
MQLLIVADDLTGAADAAVAFATSRRTAVLVRPSDEWPPVEVLAINTESRYLDSSSARKTVGEVVSRAGNRGVRVFKKVDSLLRGNIGTEIAVCLEALTGPARSVLAIVAPAFPRTGRTMVNGILHVAGSPIGSAGHLADMLSGAGLSHALVTTDDWADPKSLALRFQDMLTSGIDTAVVDAGNDSEFAAIVTAATLLGDQALLAASVETADPNRLGQQIPTPKEVFRVRGNSLAVIGSYSPTSNAQLQELLRAGFQHIYLDHKHRLDAEGPAGTIDICATVANLTEALDRGRAVLTPDLGAPLDKRQAKAVATALGATAAASSIHASSIVVSGGETALAVLTHLGVEVLEIQGEILPGVVHAAMPGFPQSFVTKSGAFGDAHTLVSAVSHLENRPVIRTEGK